MGLVFQRVGAKLDDLDDLGGSSNATGEVLRLQALPKWTTVRPRASVLGNGSGGRRRTANGLGRPRARRVAPRLLAKAAGGDGPAHQGGRAGTSKSCTGAASSLARGGHVEGLHRRAERRGLGSGSRTSAGTVAQVGKGSAAAKLGNPPGAKASTRSGAAGR